MTKVKLYMTENCPFCQMEIAWLAKNEIEHQDIYVDKDPAAAEDMVHKSGQMGVPVTEIAKDDGTIHYVLGFDQPKLALFMEIPN